MGSSSGTRKIIFATRPCEELFCAAVHICTPILRFDMCRIRQTWFSIAFPDGLATTPASCPKNPTSRRSHLASAAARRTSHLIVVVVHQGLDATVRRYLQSHPV